MQIENFRKTHPLIVNGTIIATPLIEKFNTIKNAGIPLPNKGDHRSTSHSVANPERPVGQRANNTASGSTQPKEKIAAGSSFSGLSAARNPQPDTAYADDRSTVRVQHTLQNAEFTCDSDKHNVEDEFCIFEVPAPYTGDTSPVKALCRNTELPGGLQPPEFRQSSGKNAIYNIRLETYIRDTLLMEVNHRGRPPFWLRPLATVASWLGFHGVGQTNCVSCATAVADTFKTGILHGAIPDMRGGSLNTFETCQDVAMTRYDSVAQLADKLKNCGDINAVVALRRPSWYKLFSSVDGHAVNIVKAGDTLHLIDAQKKIHILLDGTLDQGTKYQKLLRFIGPMSADEGAITLADIGFPLSAKR
ncbi:toxin glutamine deamidase domain-containing protein [Sodalis sp. RH19]|uniref:toxin glutamine deamidase domain-containing protein n=1 Tax=unclassified Sodalis (in: enterobacteria) TaxID=2636512 RepID=UPI0039B570C1